MPTSVATRSTVSLSLEELADLFTRSFEAYFYPGSLTAERLAARVRLEQLDVFRSQVLVIDDQPAGMALLGLRGSRGWCGGFGVCAPHRGQGLAAVLMAALVEQARSAGVRDLSLEVLTRNERAIKTYARAGLAIRRDLLILEWRHETAGAPPTSDTSLDLREADPALLLASFGPLHDRPAAWQRDLPTLLCQPRHRGLAIFDQGVPRAYLLWGARDETNAYIADLAGQDPADAVALIAALQQRYPQIISVNEPADSPLIPAFATAGFQESDRQHEMAMEL